MLIAGLTGGMACGKSFVARAFRDLGCFVIEADEVGHDVLLPGGDAFTPVVEAFGPGILNDKGVIDRAALAARVFAHPDELARLNAIVHPAVRQTALSKFQEIGRQDPHAVAIYVAAILLESGAYKDVQKVIVVTCTPTQQLERAMHRPGATRQDVEARIARQMPPDEKQKHADYVIDTSGKEAETLRQTRAIWENLKLQA